MARRTLEERRDEYLAIGSAIISEAWEGAVKDPALALSHVKLADVAKQAGVTKGALYYIWESQEAFWQDLLECLLEVNSTIVSDYLQHVTARRTSDVAGVPTIHDHADSLFESMSTNPRFFTRVGLVSYLSDDEVRSRFDREYQATLATYGTPLALAITSMGRRLREGFDITSVLVAFDAALEGLCLTKRIAPERTPLVQLPDGTKSTLFTVALEAVAIGFSEPVEDGESTELPVGAMADVALRLPPKSLSDSDAPMPDGNQPSRAKVRPTSKDRKEDYLRVAMDILTNFSLGESLAAPVDALAHVSIADVAERAGVTKGAIYHIWPSQEAFRRDLLIRLLDHGRRFGTEQLGKLIEVGLRGEKPLQVLHEASNATFDTLKNDPLFLAQFSFYLYSSNPSVRDLLAKGDEHVTGDFAAVVELVLDGSNRRTREPFTVQMIVTVARSLLIGMCLRYRTSPSIVDGSRNSNSALPSRLASALEAVLMHFSEPVPPSAS